MPRVKTLSGVDIFVYIGDHNPPHFHAICAGDSCLIAIANFSVIAGSISANKLKLVLVWAKRNQGVLAAAWNHFNP